MRFRGAFAYIDALPSEQLDPPWPSVEHEPSIFPSGSFAGSPEEAFDCAGNVYLQA